MPQFDTFSFASQIFWSTCFIFLFYPFFLKYPIKSTTEILKTRDILSTNLIVEKTKSLDYFFKLQLKNKNNTITR
jgi:hypothetical protein